MVMLTEDDAPFRSLRIIIGQPEAKAILAGWHGAVPGRPSTWDLFVSTVALLEGRIDRVVITAVQEERHYFAHIELEQSGERRILACRPSDAIALAVRAYNVDILAEAAVLEAAGVLPDGSKPGKLAEEAPAEAEETLAEREAALAAREAALAARERAIMAIEADQGDAADGADPPASEVAEPVLPAGAAPEVDVAAAPTPAAAAPEPPPASSDPRAAPVANSDPAAPAS
jgi:bifunctional DNase/RNase